MRDDDRLFYAEQTVDRYAQFLRDLPTLVSRLKDMRRGYPSGGLGAGSGIRGDATQPERMADQSDPTDATLDRVNRLVLEVHARVVELDNIRLSTMPRWGTAVAADEGCRSCARVRGHWSPVYRKDPPRCRWCYDRWLELQRDPPARAVEWYLEGRRVTERMMRDALDIEAAEAAERVKPKRKKHRRPRARR